jgi:hypothetical protein
VNIPKHFKYSRLIYCDIIDLVCFTKILMKKIVRYICQMWLCITMLAIHHVRLYTVEEILPQYFFSSLFFIYSNLVECDSLIDIKLSGLEYAASIEEALHNRNHSINTIYRNVPLCKIFTTWNKQIAYNSRAALYIIDGWNECYFYQCSHLHLGVSMTN